MTAPKQRKPEPVHKQIVCSVCGLDWRTHTSGSETPTLEMCVELLKQELRRRPPVFGTQTYSQTSALQRLS